MTTLSRWWAPSGAGIGPDEVDLALLTPGQDGPKDLGQALLALHRVGAAACEAAASMPLADESTLAFALVNARAQVVPEALDIVSKAVDDRSYAGLLLKDTLDDAEAAAMSLWRTCIAKSMAPGMAAKRVGAVYGVPLRELGRYTALASDPKSRPDAVEDLADRTLFGFVAKMVAEEAVETKVTISKAPMVMENQTLAGEAYLDAHNVEHGEDGRFVREGTTVAAPALSRPSLRRPKVSRPKVSRPPASADRAELAGSRLSRARQASGKLRAGSLSTGSLTQGQLKLAALLDKTEKPLFEMAPSLSGTPRQVPDMLKRRPELENSHQLWKVASFAMSNDEWNELVANMGVGPDGERLLRSGGLTEYMGSPVLHDDEFTSSAEHEHAVDHVATLIRNDPALAKAPPRVVRTLKGVVAGEQLLINESDVYDAKRSLLLAYQDAHGVTLNLEREIKHVDAAMDSLDHDDLVLVYTPPTPGRPKEDRAYRAVMEVFLDLEAVRGTDDSSRGGADVTLDPNIALRAPGHLSGLSGRFYQRSADTFRLHVHLTATDETDLVQAEKSRRRKPFGKALTAVRFAQLEAEGTIDRDESTGEFVSPSLSRPALARPATTRPKTSRPKAMLPVQTASSLRGSQLAAGQLKSAQVAQAKLTQAQITRVAQVAAEQDESTQGVFLDDTFEYTVLDMKDLGRIIKHTEAKYLEQMYEQDIPFSLEAQLGIRARDRQHRPSIIDADQARSDLIGEAENEWAANMNWADGIWSGAVVEARITRKSELAGVARDLQAYLDEHPKVQRVHAMMTRDVDGAVRVVLRGNKSEMPAVHLVRWHDSLGQRLTLQPEGERRLLDVASLESLLKMRYEVLVERAPSQSGMEDTFTDPVVFTWRAVREPEQP